MDKITALILLNGILDFGKQTIRRPFVLEFKNIYNGEPIKFEQYRQNSGLVRRRLDEMNFGNTKAITRTMLAWQTFRNPAQELPPLGADLQIEHISAKRRQENHHVLQNAEALEFLGNKALLEKRINIRASDYRLVDKRIFYFGDGKSKPGTFNLELRRLAEEHDDFTESDILDRNEEIFDAFIAYLREQDLLT